MRLLSQLLLSRRWQESSFRKDAAAMVLLIGSFFGHQPPHIEPLPTVIGTPLGHDPDADEVEVRLPDSQRPLP
ncbi:MAG: hypothetical protein M0027_17405 [Candidatus Dormibacteraeota bacterium]|nr:hypothetical protein [Candidatus Dormibacteraeota bacterium]